MSSSTDAASSSTSATARTAAGPQPRGHPLRQAAHAGRPVGRQVGQHVREVRAEAEQRGGAGHRPAGRGVPGQRARRVRGQRAEPEQVHRPRPERRLEPQVVGPAGRDDQHVERPGERADDERQREPGRRGGPGRRPHGAGADVAARERLVGPAGGGVPRRVAGVVRPADGQLPGQQRRRGQRRADAVRRGLRRQHGRQGRDGERGTGVACDNKCLHPIQRQSRPPYINEISADPFIRHLGGTSCGTCRNIGRTLAL